LAYRRPVPFLSGLMGRYERASGSCW